MDQPPRERYRRQSSSPPPSNQQQQQQQHGVQSRESFGPLRGRLPPLQPSPYGPHPAQHHPQTHLHQQHQTQDQLSLQQQQQYQQQQQLRYTNDLQSNRPPQASSSSSSSYPNQQSFNPASYYNNNSFPSSSTSQSNAYPHHQQQQQQASSSSNSIYHPPQPTNARPTSSSSSAQQLQFNPPYTHPRSPSSYSDQSHSEGPNSKRVKREGTNASKDERGDQLDSLTGPTPTLPPTGPGPKGGGGAPKIGAGGKKRAVQSCSECRRRKIKCDRVFPCSPCQLRGDQAICREVDRHNTSSNGCASSSDLLSLSHRLAALEQVLKNSGVLRPGSVDEQAGVRGQAVTGGKLDKALKKEKGVVDAVSATTGKKGKGKGKGSAAAVVVVREEEVKGGESEEDEGSERSGGEGEERDGAESNGEGDNTGGVASETEEAAVTLEHLAFGRRKDEPSRPGPASPEQPMLPGLGRRLSVSFALNPPSTSTSSSAPFPTSSFAAGNDQPPLHTTHQHPASTSSNRQPNFPNGGTTTTSPAGQPPRRSSLSNSNTNPTTNPSFLHAPNHQHSPPNPSPPSPLHPSLPLAAGSTPFTLHNLQSRVAMGARGPTPLTGYGGPLGAKKILPELGAFGRPKGKKEEGMEGRRKMRNERDMNDPKVVFDAFFQRSEIYMEAFLTCLPGERKERALIQHYFARVEWFHHCLHVPTFLRECEEFWAIPFEQAVAECSASWVGVFLQIMCLSLHFLDDQEAARLGFSKEDQERLPAIWFAGTRGALWQSDFLTNHSLECLQIIILSGVYLANQDRADAHWGILGSGIKIAQMMGINRLGAEDPSRRWGGRWESLITREVGRRVWWNLVFLDWSLAPAYGYAATIHPDQMNTAFPGNIRDEDLVDGQLFRPVPLDVHTPMSYHLTRLRLIETAYQVIYIMNHTPHPPYEAILKVDQEFKEIEKMLPQYYRVNDRNPMGRPKSDRDEDLVLNWEKVVCNLSLQTQWLKLHRPYLSRGYKNSKYAYSTQQCIRAARAALSLIHEGVGYQGGVIFLEKWWITLFYSFVSTVVLLIDLLYTPRDLVWEEKLKEVKQALAYLKQIERTSSPARGTIKVIEALLIEVESRPVGPVPAPRKRGLSIDTASSSSDHESTTSGLQRAVRRLVHENEILASSTSPNSSNDTSADTPSPAFVAIRPPNPLAPPESTAFSTLSMPANGGNWLSAPTGFTPSVSPVMQYGYGGGPRAPSQFQTTVDSGEEANMFGSPGWNPFLGGGDALLSQNLNPGNSEDLLSQIFSLPDLDWVFKGPNTGAPI